MNLAIVTNGTNYSDQVGDSIERSPCLLILNTRSLTYELLRNPISENPNIQNTAEFLLLLIRRKVSTVIVRRCTGDMRVFLNKRGIQVIEPGSGCVGDVVTRLQRRSKSTTHVVQTAGSH